jgi:hypothetical protein
MHEPLTSAGREFARLMSDDSPSCVILREATPLEALRYFTARTRVMMRGRKRVRPGRSQFNRRGVRPIVCASVGANQ